MFQLNCCAQMNRCLDALLGNYLVVQLCLLVECMKLIVFFVGMQKEVEK
jgi:hypothetical protein